MAHPHNEHRQHRVEKSRVHHITKAYAKGGTVKHSDEAQDKKLIKSMIGKAIHAEGGKSKHRMDRPHRAKGGRVGKKGSAKTIVNVITGHSGTGMPPAPPMAPPGPPMGIGPAAMPPPGAARPPMPMPPPGAGGPPGAPPMPLRAKGGRVNQGSPVFEASLKSGTQVQHVRGKGDLDQLGRGKPITYAKGGKVKRDDGGMVTSSRSGFGGPGFYRDRSYNLASDLRERADSAKMDVENAMNAKSRANRARGGSVKNKTDPGGSDRLQYSPKSSPSSRGILNADSNTTNKRASGGRVESPEGVAKATKLPSGSGGGEARLAKAHRAARIYHGPAK